MKDFLEDYLKNLSLQDPIKNKLNEWIEDGLKPWDISRDAPYFGFEIPDEFVVGYGIDYAQRNRNLSFIGKVRFV